MIKSIEITVSTGDSDYVMNLPSAGKGTVQAFIKGQRKSAEPMTPVENLLARELIRATAEEHA